MHRSSSSLRIDVVYDRRVEPHPYPLLKALYTLACRRLAPRKQPMAAPRTESRGRRIGGSRLVRGVRRQLVRWLMLRAYLAGQYAGARTFLNDLWEYVGEPIAGFAIGAAIIVLTSGLPFVFASVLAQSLTAPPKLVTFSAGAATRSATTCLEVAVRCNQPPTDTDPGSAVR